MLNRLPHALARQSCSLRPALLGTRPLCSPLAGRAPSLLRTTFTPLRTYAATPTPPNESASQAAVRADQKAAADKRENIYTIPNALTLARIAATPVIGHFVLQGELGKATGLLFVAGLSDLLDGWLARRFNMGSVLGSILDPAADKLLMTTMVVTLAMKSMLPLPLAVLIIGRDAALALSAFYFRYASLPPPKTFTRYWDFSIPSAEVKPTELSKYNTALQLVLVGLTTVAPLLPFELGMGMTALQWVVGGTTVMSGVSYLRGTGVKYVK